MPDHAMVKIAIADIVQKIGRRESEYNAEQMTEKIWNFAWKAKKPLNFENTSTPWKELVTEFANKFFASMWAAFGDRKWMEDVEFTHLVCVAVQSYFPKEVNEKVPAMEFAQVLIDVPEYANDYNRFHWHAQDIVKEHVQTKQKSKRVLQALGDAREDVLKLGVMDVATFLRSWTQGSLSKLTSEGHPSKTLPIEQALPLFDAFANSVGVPQAILKIVDDKPRPGGSDTIAAVREAYEIYGPPPITDRWQAPAGKGGWQQQGYGGGGNWGGKGGCNPGDMMAMMMNMMKGGCGKGGCGWGPY